LHRPSRAHGQHRSGFRAREWSLGAITQVLSSLPWAPAFSEFVVSTTVTAALGPPGGSSTSLTQVGLHAEFAASKETLRVAPTAPAKARIWDLLTKLKEHSTTVTRGNSGKGRSNLYPPFPGGLAPGRYSRTSFPMERYKAQAVTLPSQASITKPLFAARSFP
jgi:hypothetical protein